MRRNRLIPGLCAGIAVAVVLTITAGPAAAHVQPDPGEAPKGGDARIAFRVPDERDDASTVKVVIAFPTDHPVPSVSVESKPGWTISVEKMKLSKPLQTDDGTVTEAVSRVTWSGGQIAPGRFDDFAVSLESIPDDTDELVFKALQTYSDGQVVRWIELTGSDGKEPDHPAPTVKLVAPAAIAGREPVATTAAPTDKAIATQVSTKGLASKDDVDSAKTIGTIGIAVGAVALLAGAVAIGLGRRRSPD